MAFEEGKRVHAHLVIDSLGLNTFIETVLVVMYTKCGSLTDASFTFHAMEERNVVSWTAIIAAYLQAGDAIEAFHLFGGMQEDGIRPSRITFITIVHGCADSGSLVKAYADGVTLV